MNMVGLLVPFRGKICRFVPLSVLKPKMTTVKIIASPFRVLSRENMTAVTFRIGISQG